MRRKTLSDRMVKELKPRTVRYAVPDPEMTGHYVRVAPSSAKVYIVVARARAGKQVWATIGATDVLTIAEARERARHAIQRIRDGLPAMATPSANVASVYQDWLRRHVDARGLRSARKIRQLLDQHVYPAWGALPFEDIRRSDIAKLVDHIEDTSGARTADYVLAIVRSIANWYATRSDGYQPPFVRGMRRIDPKQRARSRVLDDDELRTVWQAAGGAGAFGAFVKLALLTAQRSDKVVTMKWSDIDPDWVWSIPKAPREKDNAGYLKLPPLALAIIKAQPMLGENPYVLAGRRNQPIRDLSGTKLRLDAVVGIAPWCIHDLRRSARSLMARAGVSREIAERVLGHAIPGVEGIYNRFQYEREKAEALERLARLIETIVGANVVALRG
jgi:integrase